MRKSISLGQKLAWMSGIIMVPLMAMVIYLILSLISYGESYNNIVKNITVASGHNFTFREQLDYTIYRIVINEKTYQELEQSEQYQSGFEGDRLKNPYQVINQAKDSFANLLQENKAAGNKQQIDQLQWIVKSIERLEDTLITIEDNVRNRVPYRENEKLLNNAVYILTEMIQEAIQQYIQNEAEGMETIRLDLKKQQDQVVTFSCYALLIIFLLSVWISRKITQSVTRPIKALCEAADQVAKGDFASPTEIDAGDEIQVLSKSFNHMKVEIGRLIEHVKEEQDNLKEMELKLLQAQINPHFLYNTLDAIVWLAESGQNQQVVSMVTSLSEFFRTGLSKGKDFITVKEEASHVEHYLEIQQFRYQDILEYEIQVDQRLYDYMILKLTLQPIVENALYHGIKNKRGKGMIRVLGELADDRMVFQVIDNGAGLSPAVLKRLRASIKRFDGGPKSGFGLANVNERIKITYGESYGIDFDSVEGEGTTVTITLPLNEKSKENILLSKKNTLT